MKVFSLTPFLRGRCPFFNKLLDVRAQAFSLAQNPLASRLAPKAIAPVCARNMDQLETGIEKAIRAIAQLFYIPGLRKKPVSAIAQKHLNC